MGYCANCDQYFKTAKHPQLCKQCSMELCGTPPGLNAFQMRYEKAMQEQKWKEDAHNRFYTLATLMDLSAIEILTNPTALAVLVAQLPEGHPPWFSLLRAWHFTRPGGGAFRGAVAKEKKPKQKFLDKYKPNTPTK